MRQGGIQAAIYNVNRKAETPPWKVVDMLPWVALRNPPKPLEEADADEQVDAFDKLFG